MCVAVDLIALVVVAALRNGNDVVAMIDTANEAHAGPALRAHRAPVHEGNQT